MVQNGFTRQLYRHYGSISQCSPLALLYWAGAGSFHCAPDREMNLCAGPDEPWSCRSSAPSFLNPSSAPEVEMGRPYAFPWLLSSYENDFRRDFIPAICAILAELFAAGSNARPSGIRASNGDCNCSIQPRLDIRSHIVRNSVESANARARHHNGPSYNGPVAFGPYRSMNTPVPTQACRTGEAHCAGHSGSLHFHFVLSSILSGQRDLGSDQPPDGGRALKRLAPNRRPFSFHYAWTSPPRMRSTIRCHDQITRCFLKRVKLLGPPILAP